MYTILSTPRNSVTMAVAITVYIHIEDETMELSPGIHQISEDEYHALSAFSNTDLKLIARSPAHYYAARLDPERAPEVVTPAKLAGRILHCAILEPEAFDSKFVTVPEDAPRKPSITQRNAKNPSEDSIRAILYWDEFEAQYADRTIISSDDWTKYRRIADSVRAHPELRGLMQGAAVEQTFIAKDPETGMLKRCRADVVNTIDSYRVAIDFKSAEDARKGPFERACYNYGYFHQDAFYRDTIEESGYGALDAFMFAAFEKEPPYAVKLYEASKDAVSRARQQYRKSLHIAAECKRAGKWPAYETDIEVVDYPAWAKE